jgi:hypothetical protein
MRDKHDILPWKRLRKGALLTAASLIALLVLSSWLNFRQSSHSAFVFAGQTYVHQVGNEQWQTVSPKITEDAERHQADVGIVVSYCNEADDTVEFMESCVRNITRETELTVDIKYYCKCSAHSFCDVYLPNIGREGQTFVWHILNMHDSLNLVTVFVNGGFLSKPQKMGTSALRKIADELAQTYSTVGLKDKLSDFFSDGGKSSLDESQFHYTAPVNCSVVEEHCSVDANRCTLADLPCEGESRCACSPQSNCSWTGSTKNNPVILNGHLEPAVNEEGGTHSMFTWACEKLGIMPARIIGCGYEWSATFAVGRNRLQRLPLGAFAELLREYDSHGANGGVVVHYMERLWRSMYLC